jgi:hypothetical protein
LAISAGSLLTDIRIQFGDPDRDFITDAIGLEWLTEGQERFCHEVMPLDEVGDFSVTSGVKRYDLPTNCIIPFTGVYWKNARRELAAVDPSEWDTYEARRILSSGTPCVFSVIRQQLVIGPAAPSGNSATALASGAITAAATTIGLTAASGTFRSRGWIKKAFHRYLKQYVLFLAWRARGDKAKADAAYTQFEQEEKRAKDTVGRRIYAPRFIKDRRYSGGRGLGWGDGM